MLFFFAPLLFVLWNALDPFFFSKVTTTSTSINFFINNLNQALRDIQGVVRNLQAERGGKEEGSSRISKVRNIITAVNQF